MTPIECFGFQQEEGWEEHVGSSPSLSPHILCCLHTYSLAQRNLNKGILIYIKGGILFTFSFNFPFPLEVIFCLPPSTCVPAKLTRDSMKDGLMLSLKDKLNRLEYLYKIHLIASLLPNCYFQKLLLQIPSLSLNLKKNKSPILPTFITICMRINRSYP